MDFMEFSKEATRLLSEAQCLEKKAGMSESITEFVSQVETSHHERASYSLGVL